MILQLVGSVMLYIATQLVEATHEVNNTLDRGKFNFWYQWRNSEVSATAWMNLMIEGYSTTHPNLNTTLH